MTIATWLFPDFQDCTFKTRDRTLVITVEIEKLSALTHAISGAAQAIVNLQEFDAIEIDAGGITTYITLEQLRVTSDFTSQMKL